MKGPLGEQKLWHRFWKPSVCV